MTVGKEVRKKVKLVYFSYMNLACCWTYSSCYCWLKTESCHLNMPFVWLYLPFGKIQICMMYLNLDCGFFLYNWSTEMLLYSKTILVFWCTFIFTYQSKSFVSFHFVFWTMIDIAWLSRKEKGNVFKHKLNILWQFEILVEREKEEDSERFLTDFCHGKEVCFIGHKLL